MKKHPYIMVIDDEQTVLRLLDRTLKLEGYSVIMADNGSAALDLLEEHSPDLVILDIMMPGLDGMQTLNFIRQRSNIPVIMISGMREVTIARDVLSLGADDFVRKPFHTGELVARVKAKLRRTLPEVAMAG